MAVKEIDVQQLRIGMYIVGMDVSWLKTPFLVHRLELKDKNQIQSIINSGAKKITIDLDRGLDIDEPIPAIPNVPASVREAPTSFQAELGQAKKVRSATRKTMQRALGMIQQDEEFKASMLTPLIDETVSSLLRNSTALLALVHQRPQGMHLINHAFNCMTLSLLLGQQMQLTDQELESLGMAALLMDIGWVQLPMDWFALGHGYSDEEFDKIRGHVDTSVDILERGQFSTDVIHLVEHHHERFNGGGYPNGVAETGIPIGSQILSLVDHFDSQVNGYYDSPSVIPATAVRTIYGNAKNGGHPARLAQALVTILGIYPVSSAVLLNTGERGLVTRVNWKSPLQPRVKLLYNRTKQPLTKPFEIDLSNQHNADQERSIRSVIDPGNKAEDPQGLLVMPED